MYFVSFNFRTHVRDYRLSRSVVRTVAREKPCTSQSHMPQISKPYFAICALHSAYACCYGIGRGLQWRTAAMSRIFSCTLAKGTPHHARTVRAPTCTCEYRKGSPYTTSCLTTNRLITRPLCRTVAPVSGYCTRVLY